MPFSSSVSHPNAHRVRIIGGRYRGRVIRFPRAEGVRPTPDRVRETLFNWLGQDLAELSTLDLYAGSGALALEALSRGAALAVAIDRDAGPAGAAKVRPGNSSRARRSRRQECVGIAAVVFLGCGDRRINDLCQPNCELFPVCTPAPSERNGSRSTARSATFRGRLPRPIRCNLTLAPVFWRGGRIEPHAGHSRGQAMTTANKHFVRSDTLEDSAPALASVTPFPRTAEAGVEAGPGAQVASSTSRGWPVKAVIAALLAAIVGVVVWIAMREPAAAPTAVAETPPLELAAVDVETVALADAVTLAAVVGFDVADRAGDLEIEGRRRSRAAAVREGQDVREGEVIARIDTRNLQAQYDRELAAVERARADLDLATLNRDKNRSLLEKNYISQNTFEQTESAYAGSVANLKLAEAQARLAKINLEDAVMRAPFAGTIAKRLVQPGEKVSPDSSIVTLVDLRQMVLEAAVPAAEIPCGRDRPAGAFQGRRLRRARIRRQSAADQSDDVRGLALDHDLYRRAESEPRAERRHVRARRAHAGQDRARAGRAAARSARGSGRAYVYTLRDDKIARTTVKVGAAAPGSSFVEVRGGLAAAIASSSPRSPPHRSARKSRRTQRVCLHRSSALSSRNR